MRPNHAPHMPSLGEGGKGARQKQASHPASGHGRVHIERIDLRVVTDAGVAGTSHARHAQNTALFIFRDEDSFAHCKCDRIPPAGALALYGHCGKGASRQDQRVSVTPGFDIDPRDRFGISRARFAENRG